MGEKSEQPTGKRLLDARRKGQVARSQNLSAAALLSAAVVLVYAFGASMLEGIGSVMRRALDPESLGTTLTTEPLMRDMIFFGGQTVRVVAPIMVIMFVIALAEQIVQVGWFVSADPLQPKLSKFNPIKGLKKLFSLRSLVKGVVDVCKLTVIGLVAWVVIGINQERIATLATLTVVGALVEIARLVFELALWVLAVLLFIGVVDWLYQKWQHTSDLKMTKHEVKEERKTVEGDMQTKARRMRMAREIVRQRLQAAVPQADVIVTNPTHFSVAIKYDAETMAAPRVIAKGADFLAMQIRLIGAAHGVPIVERPALARALYANVDVGREVPAAQYEAVAEVLAYVYRLEGRMAS